MADLSQSAVIMMYLFVVWVIKINTLQAGQFKLFAALKADMLMDQVPTDLVPHEIPSLGLQRVTILSGPHWLAMAAGMWGRHLSCTSLSKGTNPTQGGFTLMV